MKMHPFLKERLEEIDKIARRDREQVLAWENHLPALNPEPSRLTWRVGFLVLVYPYDRELMEQMRAQMTFQGWKLDREITEAEICHSWEDPTQYWTQNERTLLIEFDDHQEGSTCQRRIISQIPHTKTETQYTFEYCSGGNRGH
jgi:hypothetical protein